MSEWNFNMEEAPRQADVFIILWSSSHEDARRAWASWQRDRWYGVDDYGLTFDSVLHKETPIAWQPLPSPPKET